MPATVLDGKALAARIRGEPQAGDRTPGGRRDHARSGGRAGRRRSRVADLRSQQDEGLRARPASRPSITGCPPTTSDGELLALVASLNADPARRRHPDPAAAARADRRAARAVRGRSAQGRRRHPPGERGPPADGRAALRRVHAVRRDEADRGGAAAAGGRAGGRRRPFEHGRQADGGAAARRRRHRHGLPLEDARSRGDRRARRPAGRRGRPARDDPRRLDQAGRRRHRRRHQPDRGRASCWATSSTPRPRRAPPRSPRSPAASGR